MELAQVSEVLTKSRISDYILLGQLKYLLSEVFYLKIRVMTPESNRGIQSLVERGATKEYLTRVYAVAKEWMQEVLPSTLLPKGSVEIVPFHEDYPEGQYIGQVRNIHYIRHNPNTYSSQEDHPDQVTLAAHDVAVAIHELLHVVHYERLQEMLGEKAASFFWGESHDLNAVVSDEELAVSTPERITELVLARMPARDNTEPISLTDVVCEGVAEYGMYYVLEHMRQKMALAGKSQAETAILHVQEETQEELSCGLELDASIEQTIGLLRELSAKLGGKDPREKDLIALLRQRHIDYSLGYQLVSQFSGLTIEEIFQQVEAIDLHAGREIAYGTNEFRATLENPTIIPLIQ